jgi:hypothetical protein
MSACPMYPLLTLAGSLRTWQVRYCQGEFTSCERYKRTLQGRQVPANLMPNGMSLRQQPTSSAK